MYLVIEVSKEDAQQILFNDYHGISQRIVNGGEEYDFSVANSGEEYQMTVCRCDELCCDDD